MHVYQVFATRPEKMWPSSPVVSSVTLSWRPDLRMIRPVGGLGQERWSRAQVPERGAAGHVAGKRPGVLELGHNHLARSTQGNRLESMASVRLRPCRR